MTIKGENVRGVLITHGRDPDEVVGDTRPIITPNSCDCATSEGTSHRTDSLSQKVLQQARLLGTQLNLSPSSRLWARTSFQLAPSV